MNLNQNPRIEELVSLLSSVNDNTSNHTMWVGVDGEVHLEAVDARSLADSPKVQFRYETCIKGNGYVGAKSVKDASYVKREYDALVKNWADKEKGYIDWR